MLAAGVGNRLFDGNDGAPPKVLLEFGGKTLLTRHLENLRALGIDELVMVLGYRQDAVEAELHVLGADFVRTISNPRYREGAVVSFWTARDEFDRDVLFMDADVLYDPALLTRLLAHPHPNRLLLDRNFEDGAEPVRVAVRDGRVVDFGKAIAGDFDVVGEWPGFLKVGPEMGRRLVDRAGRFVAEGRAHEPYEPAIREVLRNAPDDWAFEDVTGTAWIEIDFAEDVARARDIILPRLSVDTPV